eukprot:scaffold40234_cov68-Phaeocystis_antarctica.AAC.14
MSRMTPQRTTTLDFIDPTRVREPRHCRDALCTSYILLCSHFTTQHELEPATHPAPCAAPPRLELPQVAPCLSRRYTIASGRTLSIAQPHLRYTIDI